MKSAFTIHVIGSPSECSTEGALYYTVHGTALFPSFHVS